MKVLVHQIKNLVLNLLKQIQNNADNGYLFVNEKEIIQFKADNKNLNFPTQFCLWSISHGFSANKSREVSLNGNVYDFQLITILLTNLTF